MIDERTRTIEKQKKADIVDGIVCKQTMSSTSCSLAQWTSREKEKKKLVKPCKAFDELFLSYKFNDGLNTKKNLAYFYSNYEEGFRRLSWTFCVCLWWKRTVVVNYQKNYIEAYFLQDTAQFSFSQVLHMPVQSRAFCSLLLIRLLTSLKDVCYDLRRKLSRHITIN